jgi:hypothetical protein
VAACDAPISCFSGDNLPVVGGDGDHRAERGLVNGVAHSALLVARQRRRPDFPAHPHADAISQQGALAQRNLADRHLIAMLVGIFLPLILVLGLTGSFAALRSDRSRTP